MLVVVFRWSPDTTILDADSDGPTSGSASVVSACEHTVSRLERLRQVPSVLTQQVLSVPVRTIKTPDADPDGRRRVMVVHGPMVTSAVISTGSEPMVTARLGQMVTLGPCRVAEQPLRRPGPRGHGWCRVGSSISSTSYLAGPRSGGPSRAAAWSRSVGHESGRRPVRDLARGPPARLGHHCAGGDCPSG